VLKRLAHKHGIWSSLVTLTNGLITCQVVFNIFLWYFISFFFYSRVLIRIPSHTGLRVHSSIFGPTQVATYIMQWPTIVVLRTAFSIISLWPISHYGRLHVETKEAQHSLYILIKPIKTLRNSLSRFILFVNVWVWVCVQLDQINLNLQ